MSDSSTIHTEPDSISNADNKPDSNQCRSFDSSVGVVDVVDSDSLSSLPPAPVSPPSLGDDRTDSDDTNPCNCNLISSPSSSSSSCSCSSPSLSSSLPTCCGCEHLLFLSSLSPILFKLKPSAEVTSHKKSRSHIFTFRVSDLKDRKKKMKERERERDRTKRERERERDRTKRERERERDRTKRERERERDRTKEVERESSGPTRCSDAIGDSDERKWMCAIFILMVLALPVAVYFTLQYIESQVLTQPSRPDSNRAPHSAVDKWQFALASASPSSSSSSSSPFLSLSAATSASTSSVSLSSSSLRLFPFPLSLSPLFSIPSLFFSFFHRFAFLNNDTESFSLNPSSISSSLARVPQSLEARTDETNEKEPEIRMNEWLRTDDFPTFDLEAEQEQNDKVASKQQEEMDRAEWAASVWRKKRRTG